MHGGTLQCDEAEPAATVRPTIDTSMVDSETVHRDNKIQTRFRLIDKIGEGTYGVVFKAEDRLNPDEGPVALKKIWLDERGEGVPVTTLREVALLKELNHVNIVRMRDFIAMTPRLFLVFDFLDQDLKQCLDSHFSNGTPPLFVKWCMLQILRGSPPPPPQRSYTSRPAPVLVPLEPHACATPRLAQDSSFATGSE